MLVCVVRAGDGAGNEPCRLEATVVRRPGGSLVHGGPGEEGGSSVQGSKPSEAIPLYRSTENTENLTSKGL